MKRDIARKVRRNRLFAMPVIATIIIMVCVGCAECEVDYDCPGSEICKVALGQCQQAECTQHQDCPPAHQCVRNQCALLQPSRPQGGVDALVLDQAE